MLNRNEIGQFLERAAKVDRTKTWQLAKSLDEATAIIAELRDNIDALARGDYPYQYRETR